MNSVLDEPKVERGAEVRGGCGGTCCGHDAKAAVSAKLEDSKFAAERLLRRGRHAFEDGIEETTHEIKRHPFGALAIAFAAGSALAFLVPRKAKG